MKDLVEIIGSFGGLVILAALFVWSYFQDKTKNEKRDEENQQMLARIDKSNENIAESIKAINSTTEVLREYIIEHDKRTKIIGDNVEYIRKKMEEE